MIARLALCILLVFAATALTAGDDKAPAAAEPVKTPVFEKFKQLDGDWVAKKQGDDHEFPISYKLTSGGTAVVETIGAGADHEMVTVIHADGDHVMLTHYCMLGNQPQMKAPASVDSNKVDFQFVRATNLKSDKDLHMHNVSFTFVDKETVKTEWTHFTDGKDSGTVVFELKRKKK